MLVPFLVLFFCALPYTASSSLQIPMAPPLRLQLYHLDFTSSSRLQNTSSFADRIGAAIERSARRSRRLARWQLAAEEYWQRVTVVAAAADGAFVAEGLAMGTPARAFRAIVDTGSDLVWQRCRTAAGGASSFDPAQSSTFRNASCESEACRALQQRTNKSCAADDCVYRYEYGGGASALGWLAYDTLAVGGAAVAGFAWGCGVGVAGLNGGVDGVVGLGQGSLSLISQISAARFSYCLAPLAAPSPLFLGGGASPSAAAQVTPIITNIHSPTFYYVNLIGISINGTLLSIPRKTFSINQNDGSGGMIIDSGTTITYLEEKGYRIVQRAIQTYLYKFKAASRMLYGLNLCYQFIQDKYLPKLTFHFQGADLDAPASNLFLHIGEYTCLALGSTRGISILGNLQQQNYHILFNLASRQISFTQTICNQMTKELNHS